MILVLVLAGFGASQSHCLGGRFNFFFVNNLCLLIVGEDGHWKMIFISNGWLNHGLVVIVMWLQNEYSTHVEFFDIDKK